MLHPSLTPLPCPSPYSHFINFHICLCIHTEVEIYLGLINTETEQGKVSVLWKPILIRGGTQTSLRTNSPGNWINLNMSVSLPKSNKFVHVRARQTKKFKHVYGLQSNEFKYIRTQQSSEWGERVCAVKLVNKFIIIYHVYLSKITSQ